MQRQKAVFDRKLKAESSNAWRQPSIVAISMLPGAGAEEPGRGEGLGCPMLSFYSASGNFESILVQYAAHVQCERLGFG